MLPTTETVGIINTAPTLIASLQATEAMKLLMESPALITRFRVIDLWTGEWQNISVRRDPDCPCCGKGEFRFLES